MTTAYPGALDALTNPVAGDQLTSPSHAGQHATANDAIEAMQAAMGVWLNARAKAQRLSAWPVPTATNTAIPFNSVDAYDTNTFHDTVTNNTRVTIPTGLGGLYLVTASISWVANSTGNRILFLRVNGAGAAATQAGVAMPTNGQGQNVVDMLELVATDYVEAITYQSSGANLNLTGWLTLLKVG